MPVWQSQTAPGTTKSTTQKKTIGFSERTSACRLRYMAKGMKQIKTKWKCLLKPASISDTVILTHVSRGLQVLQWNWLRDVGDLDRPAPQRAKSWGARPTTAVITGAGARSSFLLYALSRRDQPHWQVKPARPLWPCPCALIPLCFICALFMLDRTNMDELGMIIPHEWDSPMIHSWVHEHIYIYFSIAFSRSSAELRRVRYNSYTIHV